MKLNGYRASHRNRWLLINNRILTVQEFILLEYYIDLMDFDSRHKNFGKFEAYLDETAEVFDKKEDTIKDWHNSLLNKGFIQLADKKRNLFKIKSPERYGTALGCNAKEFAKNEKNTSTLDYILQNICFSPEKAGNNPSKHDNLALNNTSKCLGSFKSEFGLFSNGSKKIVVIKQKTKDDREYQKQYENNQEGMTPEEMKSIDENEERIEILSDEQERQIVNIFFNGNWDKYRNSLINY